MDNKIQLDTQAYFVDGKFEATRYYKDVFMCFLAGQRVEDRVVDPKDTVTLYHGTTTAYLNDILEHGLLPRKDTDQGNWQDQVASSPNVVYMTNKWHYLYAYNATGAYIEKVEKNTGKEQEPWFKSWLTFPCYIECVVPKALLVADEDFFHSRYISNRIQSSLRSGKEFSIDSIDPLECLAHYGTAGVLGGIKPEYIKSFSILGELELYRELMFSNSPYKKDTEKWGAGKGKGKVELLDIMKREDQSLHNAAFFMHQIPKGRRIGQIGINPKTGTLSLAFQKE